MIRLSRVHGPLDAFTAERIEQQAKYDRRSHQWLAAEVATNIAEGAATGLPAENDLWFFIGLTRLIDEAR